MHFRLSVYIILLLQFNGMAQSDTEVTSGVSDSITLLFPSTCKRPLPVIFKVENNGRRVIEGTDSKLIGSTPVLSFHGTMSYEHFERRSDGSQIFLGENISDQLKLQLHVLYKEQTPFLLDVQYTKMSPFQLQDKWQVSFAFDELQYNENLKSQILQKMETRLSKEKHDLLSRYDSRFKEYYLQKEKLSSPAFRERLIKENLAMANPFRIAETSFPVSGSSMQIPAFPAWEANGRKRPDAVSKHADSIRQLEFSREQLKLDSLAALYKKAEDSISAFNLSFKKQMDSVSMALSALNNAKDIKQLGESMGMKDSTEIPKVIRMLSASNLKAGNFIADHSELTVAGMIVTGIGVKYGRESFVQFSGGKYDFQFRRLFTFSDSIDQGKPGVVAVKFGRMQDNGLKAINIYLGQKSSGANMELRPVAGVSLERKIQVSRHFSVHAELAKSTEKPLFNTEKDEKLSHLFTRLDMKTLALNAGAEALIPATKTDVTVSYAFSGPRFESLNVSSYYNPQHRMSARLNQPLFKRKVTLSTGIKYTEYNSYGLSSNVGSKTYFGSASATMRFKNLPVVYIGYFPGSQLYWQQDLKLYQYVYYNLHASANHGFQLRRIPVNTTVSYNKLLNRFSDSVVSGNQTSYNVFITSWINKLSFLTNYSFYQMDKESHNVLEAGAMYSAAIISAGGSLKYNIGNINREVGYSLTISCRKFRLGAIGFSLDKSFLPDRTGRLVSVSTGRLQLVKPLKFKL